MDIYSALIRAGTLPLLRFVQPTSVDFVPKALC